MLSNCCQGREPVSGPPLIPFSSYVDELHAGKFGKRRPWRRHRHLLERHPIWVTRCSYTCHLFLYANPFCSFLQCFGKRRTIGHFPKGDQHSGGTLVISRAQQPHESNRLIHPCIGPCLGLVSLTAALHVAERQCRQRIGASGARVARHAGRGHTLPETNARPHTEYREAPAPGLSRLRVSFLTKKSLSTAG